MKARSAWDRETVFDALRDFGRPATENEIHMAAGIGAGETEAAIAWLLSKKLIRYAGWARYEIRPVPPAPPGYPHPGPYRGAR